MLFRSKKNPGKFKNPEMVRASHILISANPYQIGEEIKGKSKKEIAVKDLEKQVEAVLAEKKELAEKLDKEQEREDAVISGYILF